MGVGDDDREEDRDRRGEGHRVAARGDEIDQNHERQQQVDPPQQAAQHGQLLALDAAQAQLFGLEVDGDEDAGEIQDRGQDGPDDDARIGHADVFGHQEGRCAHERRHDLPAGRGGGVDRAGEFAPITGLLHHRDRDRAGRDRVAHRRAGHHAAQRRGNDRHLGRAAGEAADEGVGQVDEELRDARALEEGAEDDEDDDEFRTDLHRRVEQPAALHLVEQADRDVAHGAPQAKIL